MRTDEAVRTALRELAGEVRSVDLIRSALRQGRRHRQRQRYLATGVAAAVTAIVMITGFLTLPIGGRLVGRPGAHLQSSELAAAPSPKPLPVNGTPAELLSGWYAQGQLAADSRTSMVLDLVHHRYVPVSGDLIWPSSTGTAVASTSYQDSDTFSVTQFATGKTSTVSMPGWILDPQWSPDGTRLLFTVASKGSSRFQAKILTVATARITSFPVDVPANSCVRCGLTWLPDGKRIAIPQVDPKSPNLTSEDDDRQLGLEILSDAGARLEFLTVHGWVTGTYAWSPDLRYVVVVGTVQRDGHWRETPMLVEVATGQVVRQVLSANAYWVDNTRALYVLERPEDMSGAYTLDSSRVTLRSVDGAVVDQWTTGNSWYVQSLAHG